VKAARSGVKDNPLTTQRRIESQAAYRARKLAPPKGFEESLRSLSPIRQLVLFYVWQGFSHAEIAEAVQTAPSTVVKHIQASREQLGFYGSNLELALAIREATA
jgi:DNA-binding NarL/FixJ family response regulator